MKVEANDLREGQIIDMNGRLWQVGRMTHTKPGKGGAYVQVELKDLQGGTKINERFSVTETIERAYLEATPCQFLYEDDGTVFFMNFETYDQFGVDRNLIGEPARFLQDGMQVTVQMYEGQPVRVELPNTITAEVVEAEPVVKGQTATASYKPATLDNGVRIMVPPHIDTGTKVVVKTSDGSYVERVRS